MENHFLCCLIKIAEKVKGDNDLIVFNSYLQSVENWIECTLEFKEGGIKGIGKIKQRDF